MAVRKRVVPLWQDFLAQARSEVDWLTVGPVLCLDPGETTGFAVFNEGRLIHTGQEATGARPALMAELIETLNGHQDPDHPFLWHIVYEEYRIRGNKAQQHIGSEVVTIKHIGAIEATADRLGIPVTKQAAGLAKGFANDEKLKDWGLYQTGQRHANDAIRHGVYWHLQVAPKRVTGEAHGEDQGEDQG